MVDGIRTIDLPLKSVATEVICNTDIGAGPEGPVRVKTLHLAALMAVDGGLAFASWAALNAVTGTVVGERAEVYGDAGTHTDPVVGGTKQNTGVYSWSASPAGWQWLSAEASLRGTTIHATSGIPANTVGIDGDWAIDPVTYEIWGHKGRVTPGVWPAGSIGAAAAALSAANDSAAAHADRLAADASATSAASDAALVAGALAAAQLSSIDFVAGAAVLKGFRLRYATQCYDTEFEVMANHTSNANPLVDLRAGRLRVVSQERRLSKQFVYPAGWAGRVLPIYFRDDGVPTTPYDHDYAFRRAFMVPPTDPGIIGDAEYYVSQSGNNANAGTSRGVSLLTLAAALAKPDVGTVYIEGSESFYAWSAIGGKSVNIVGHGAHKVRFFNSPGANLSAFSATAPYSNVFEATSNFPIERPCSPFLLDEDGLPVGYEEVADAAAVSDTGPFSFAVDNASTPKKIWVWAKTAPVVGTDIYVALQSVNTNHAFAAADTNTNKTVYLENLLRRSLVLRGQFAGDELRVNWRPEHGNSSVRD